MPMAKNILLIESDFTDICTIPHILHHVHRAHTHTQEDKNVLLYS